MGLKSPSVQGLGRRLENWAALTQGARAESEGLMFHADNLGRPIEQVPALGIRPEYVAIVDDKPLM